jgi:hypothetical protein
MFCSPVFPSSTDFKPFNTSGKNLSIYIVSANAKITGYKRVNIDLK